jgi:hypothetical protein
VLAYHALFHALRGGQTPGKRTLGIRVLSADGLPPTVMQIVLRALLWPIDVLLPVPAPIGLMLIAATSRRPAARRPVRRDAQSCGLRRRGGAEPFRDRTWSRVRGEEASR